MNLPGRVGDSAVRLARRRGVDAGLIGVDRRGKVGVGFNTRDMDVVVRRG